MKNIIAFIAFTVCVVVGYRVVLPAYAAVKPTISTDVILPPVSIGLIYASGDSKKKQVSMGVRVLSLFDGDVYTGYEPSRNVKLSFEQVSSIRRIKILGGKGYRLSVLSSSGQTTSLDMLNNVSLTAASDGWKTIVLSSSLEVKGLQFKFEAIKGQKTEPIQEVQVWSEGSHAVIFHAGDLFDHIKDASLAPQVRVIGAEDKEIYVSPSATPEELVYNIVLKHYPAAIKRALLVYEVHGLDHWVTVERSINKGVKQGGFLMPHGSQWLEQVEEISPEWLKHGDNEFSFSVKKGMSYTYSIRNLRVLLELKNGHNFIAELPVNKEGNIHPAFDGDIESVWDISSGDEDGKREVEVAFDGAVAVSSVNVYFDAKSSVNMTIFSQDANGKWAALTAPKLNNGFQKGWNTVPLSDTLETSGIRLHFDDNSGVAVEVGEVYFSGSVLGSQKPRIVVGFPDKGQFYGRSAYIRGFVQPWQSIKDTKLEVAGKKVVSDDGSFALVINKDASGFEEQADSDAWSIKVDASYDGEHVSKLIHLNNYHEPIVWSSDDKMPSRSKTMRPDVSDELSFDGATLSVQAGALSKSTTLSIISLTSKDLPKLDPGMTNVTKGPRAGYRFLPHGTKFKKKINVAMQVDPALLPAGMSLKDVRTFYFDEEVGRWVPLEKVAFVASTNEIKSMTNHFTNMIAATLRVPDHPTPMSFNPNSMKDIKAADPGAGINLIAPPKANNMGDARLSYPIELPPGRNGLQPQLAVQYNSAGGNGWMGLGWDLSTPSITVDTRWGVPRYSLSKETETYLLNGEMLTPVAHRSKLLDRVRGQRVFHTRIEGKFHKIVRYGNTPSTYWWEVIDKMGKHFYYGASARGTAPDSTAILKGKKGIAKWALLEVWDSNGNSIKYGYEHVVQQAQNLAGGVQLYLKDINYSGYEGRKGYYTVEFKRDRELGSTGRSDVSINARNGFKVVTADLLKEIVIKSKSSAIRQYVFNYKKGAFEKTLLKSVTQFGSSGGVFHTHTFDYYNEVVSREGVYNVFAPQTNWDAKNDNVRAKLVIQSKHVTVLGGSVSRSKGIHTYIGFNPLSPTKNFSAGRKTGSTRSESKGLAAFTDLNGDGLPDKVFKQGNAVYYRPNMSGPRGEYKFGEKKRIIGLQGYLTRGESSSSTKGKEGYAVGSYTNHDMSSMTSTSTYFMDVNGDGLTDFISEGTVFFNHLEKGIPTFTANSADTPVALSVGSNISGSVLPSFEEQLQKQLDRYPLMDAVRRWKAPYDGTVNISGGASLVSYTGGGRDTYETADGVRVAIQHNGLELWSKRIHETDYDVHQPSGVTGIKVKKGDRIYFRVQSVYDGSFDQVLWTPKIEYAGVTSHTDANLLNPYQFNASKDFTFAGQGGQVVMPLNGKVRIVGDLSKLAPTSDDIQLVIKRTRNKVTQEVFSRGLTANAAGTIPLDILLDVRELDKLKLYISIDSRIDLSKIEWAPELYYTEAVGGNGDVITVTNDDGEYIYRMSALHDMDLYPNDDLLDPQQAWVAKADGKIEVTPKVRLRTRFEGDGRIAFTVKRKGALVGKRVFKISKGKVNNENRILVFNVKKGDRIFFNFSSQDLGLKANIISYSALVAYQLSTADPKSVFSGFHWAGGPDWITEPYRGWSYFAYNGNGHELSAIVESELAVPYNENTQGTQSLPKVFAYAPFTRAIWQGLGDIPQGFPVSGYWGGTDEFNWIQKESMSSSRLGRDYIKVPQGNDFAGAVAPPRISLSSQSSHGAGIGGGSITTSGGDVHSLLTFMDLNGDRFPDVVSSIGVQYTNMGGGLGGETHSFAQAYFGLTASKSSSRSLGVGGGGSRSQEDSDGGSNSAMSDLPPIGISFGGTTGDSKTKSDFVDINGDGLLDVVRQHIDGNLWVSLNLGYEFSSPENWGSGKISESKSSTYNGGLGYNDGMFGIGAGTSKTSGTNNTTWALKDVNGDGLPDIVNHKGNVSLNTGSRFVPIAWLFSQKIDAGYSASEGGGGYFTMGIGPLCLVGCYAIVNPGGNYTASMSRPEHAIQDVNGDGFPDYVYSTSDSMMNVGYSQIGKTNLLKTIHRPLGATFDIHYERSGNTYAQPQSRWVMSQTVVSDGLKGDGEDVQVTSYAYEKGYYDRLEREFYGYKKVTEHQRDTGKGSGDKLTYREVVRTFANEHYYVKGLMLSELMRTKIGSVFTETVNSYSLWDVGLKREFRRADLDNQQKMLTATIFPRLEKVESKFFEGLPESSKVTYIAYDYDEHGNVTGYFDAGDISVIEDNVEADIEYTYDPLRYIMDKPSSIIVRNASKQILRKRTSTYDANGNLTSLSEYLADGIPAQTHLTYTIHGNLKTVTGPTGYKVTYVYDGVTRTHITEVSDSFGYKSSATYDYKFGKPLITRDINGQETVYTYDEFGRTSTITGPYQRSGER